MDQDWKWHGKKKKQACCALAGVFFNFQGGGERGTGVSGPLTFFSVVLFMTESDSFGTQKRMLRFCALFFFLLSFYCELCVCKLTHDVISYFRVRECHFSFWWAFLSDMNVPFKRCCKLSLFRPACILCLVCFYCPFAGCSALLSRLKVWWETCKTGLDAVSEILEQPSGVYNILYNGYGCLCSQKLRMWRCCGLWARNYGLLLITHAWRTSAITSGWRWEILSFS